MYSVIIHHWDSDGVCSAALISKHERADANITPPIGIFALDERVRNTIKAEKLYFVDLNMPEEVLTLTKNSNYPNIIFIDHHLQNPIKSPKVNYINPVVNGKFVPSATWVVSELYRDWNFLTLLGAVGDMGLKIFDINGIKDLASKILKKESISKEELLQAVRLIDSNYISMDREAVERAVSFLKEASIKDVLKNEEWIKKAESVDKEIQKAVNSAEIENDIVFVYFKSKYAIISKVVREFVWGKKFKVCVAVNKGFNGKYQVYVRLLKENPKIKELIESVKKLGVNAGGKKEVMGCFFEADEKKLKEVLNLVEKFLPYLR